MSRIDEILAKQRDLEKQLEEAKKQERESVLKDIKMKIKLFGFKTSDFKGFLATRKKRTVVVKTVAKKTAKA